MLLNDDLRSTENKQSACQNVERALQATAEPKEYGRGRTRFKRGIRTHRTIRLRPVGRGMTI